MILALRTDQPMAELYLYDGTEQLDSITWEAHRQLSATLLEKIEELLQKNNAQLTSLKGLIVYRGPGSFTGLRIGISFVNTLAYSLQIPVSAGEGDDWLKNGLSTLPESKVQIISPLYGIEPHITKARK